MFRFLHAADIHLDSPLSGLERYEGAPVAEIRGATRRAFSNLVELALAEEVAFLLLAGDLYDGDWRDYNTGLYFAREAARLREAGIGVYVIAGNHDAASRITRHLRPPDNVRTFATHAPETVALDALGVAIHGQGFASRAVTGDLSQDYPPAVPDLFNIGLLHTSLDGRPGHRPYAPCTAAGLRAKGYQYWALGHVHRREVVCEDPWIVFPGNLQGRHARETGPKGATLVAVEDGRVRSVEHRVLDCVRWLDEAVDLSGAGDLGAVFGRVAEALEVLADRGEGRLVALRLRLAGACEADAALRAAREQVAAQCRALATDTGGGRVWLEKVLIETRPAAVEAAPAGDGAFGGLLRSIAGLELDETRLDALAPEVRDLRAKLPPELIHGEEAFDPAGPEVLRSSLPDVRELLIRRLLGGEGTE